ncbi:hypothetical protein LOTGIDRAFT_157891 [Lottia gigantea]|uniref:Lipocalin/cytosolic fatty-acid binding domain-containing protein n=1 Tax=Lottia gigantea TaxID=225164 RepID=V4A9E0_LOTGI|nr:hypothetical protein LOTGIDRAFT_157891 [Lottia gigantea]ESP00609.1 hypothetical protein LOTGIDRAFT_157891 [Lottia gigantea]
MAHQDFIEKFGGKWKQEKTENFEEYFKIMDLNIILRKLMMKVSPTEEYKLDGDYVVTINSVGPTSNQNKFKLNEEFEEERMGKKMKSLCRFEDGKLIITSTSVDNPAIKPQTVTIEKITDDQTLTTIVVGDNDLVCKRYFKRVPE